ncbi:putative ABC transporter permease protein YufQ [Paenibacillus larvae subsp. larvae]|uniref:Putative ABC transporter permease protein YufQ n=1 Tax=Paenibacillus larvae subsp. larvae TaxID=147375 RepID=A0A2L1UJL1_9BACL|nr:ABC transporter permease [Paenibacillus larvae]AQZ46857.1 sugar ABC transporter permease [Paenibacillus larvae subsp. pulvifaciens]AVF28620.1 putative ABC transporter permease protein YufQ [Paenibacillus larvae subsp. larvae]AVF33125.1 putative ABC transporter permease protein YufQ [Paenibacillus larvae subsp. larvae]MBH0341679.1 sugar ABC transporter permease [Paenibacillus larvae]MCY7521705.1 ABC transporter permease [Paenibacillus larvae]
MDLTQLGMLVNTTLVFSTPLILAALGGMFSERSGVINIGLEGLMISGAFASAIVTLYTKDAGMESASLWLGMLAAMVLGILFSLIHAVASIQFKANQVVSGVVINFLAAGATVYMVKVLFDGAGQTETISAPFSKISIPFLSDIPFLGEAFFHAYPPMYLAIILVFVCWYVLFKTPFGLRLRSVGEHPSAADTVGINVNKYRYIGVMLSGALAALGGATLTLTTTSSFSHNTVSGQGFIALAALIFGKWHPIGAMGSAIFFGFAQAISLQAQLVPWIAGLPKEFLYMLPYILTILVLAGAVGGRGKAPSALGEPYDPGKR